MLPAKSQKTSSSTATEEGQNPREPVGKARGERQTKGKQHKTTPNPGVTSSKTQRFPKHCEQRITQLSKAISAAQTSLGKTGILLLNS